LNNQVKEDEMGRTCSTNESVEECIEDIGGKARRKETTRKTKRFGVDNIKINVRAIEWGGMDWIDVAQDIDQCRSLVNTVMNFGFHKILGSS
jgi:hypothetical protein